MRGFIANVVGTGVTVVGILILVSTAALLGYGQFEQATLAKQAAELRPVPFAPSAVSTRAAANAASPHAPIAAPAAVSATAPVDTTPAAPDPTAVSPTAAPVLRIAAPSISLDARVAESPVVNGQWIIPKFEAGHLQGTAQPGTGGNVVLAGHVESITSGDVFANIAQLQPGNSIEVYTRDARVTYVVRKVEQVSNADLSVLKPGKHETLTLITCSGSWLPFQHDYSQRTVVVADRT